MSKLGKKKVIIITLTTLAALILCVVFVIVIKQLKYNHAMELKEKGEFREAYEVFEQLNGYKDSDAQMRDVTMEKGLLRECQVGDIIVFGDYNGNSTWIVLAKEDNKVLVLSEDCIIRRCYNAELTTTTWDNCSLRTWLNRAYFDSAFNTDEQAMIVETSITNTIADEDNSPPQTEDEENLSDYVFLLSIEEVNQYLPDNSDKQGDYEGQTIWWWLRSPSMYFDNYAANVSIDGPVDEYGTYVTNGSGGVRPALWISINEL
ncbi:MAG: DUF6273 domain-containing protein [Eubacteriales bacterium]|nr:DUF6273 domain-containing protein [Eubacteriales bacterium]